MRTSHRLMFIATFAILAVASSGVHTVSAAWVDYVYGVDGLLTGFVCGPPPHDGCFGVTGRTHASGLALWGFGLGLGGVPADSNTADFSVPDVGFGFSAEAQGTRNPDDSGTGSFSDVDRAFQWTSQPPFEQPTSIAFSGVQVFTTAVGGDEGFFELDFSGKARPASAVPEPSSIALLASGLGALIALRRSTSRGSVRRGSRDHTVSRFVKLGCRRISATSPASLPFSIT